MRHIILALVFTFLVAALLISGCAKASSETVEDKAMGLADVPVADAIESTDTEVTQASEDIAAMEQDLDVDEVDLDFGSLFDDY